MKHPIGLLGGTFDPIHIGHLRSALVAREKFQLQEVRFIPCKQPVHKPAAHATNTQRLAMLKIAIADQPDFIIDDRELHRATPSYTVETLTSLRKDVGAQPLCLIIGSDSLVELHTWHQWQQIPELAHLIVIHRPDFVIPKKGHIATLLKKRLISDPQQLTKQPAGAIILQHMPLLAISSTDIREQITQGLNPRYLLPDNVLDYIWKNHIYEKNSRL